MGRKTEDMMGEDRGEWKSTESDKGKRDCRGESAGR